MLLSIVIFPLIVEQLTHNSMHLNSSRDTNTTLGSRTIFVCLYLLGGPLPLPPPPPPPPPPPRPRPLPLPPPDPTGADF